MAAAFSSSSSLHDVFLSFRGEDTRRTFTSHLYHALRRSKINTFIDDEGIERGETISPALLSAIETSKICVIVLSPNYAASPWCLDELQKIAECYKEKMNKKKEFVMIPVFYHIDPADVRHQRGTYEHAFSQHEERFKDNLIKVQKWRRALFEAANSAGWDSSNIRTEADLVEKVVEDIILKLNRMSPHVPKGLVGIAQHITRMESLLCTGSADVRIIGIWGMGGIGKTTIAHALCAKLSHQYHGSYHFIANVREEWKNHREKKLRNKLLAEILGDKGFYFSTPTMSSTFVLERLRRKKLLIVLDDVSDSKQIEYLVGDKDCFGPGSRIIVTTRNKDVFNKGVDGIYRVEELNFQEALKLFSFSAFQQDSPLSEFENLSQRAVDYAKGIPLALKVMGSCLCSKRPREWESELEKLKKIPKTEIHDSLRLSYEGLDSEVQDIFLDIACCLKGETTIRITSILDGCGFSTEIGLTNLQDKSLVTISEGNEVQMHDLIQEMGWQIVREESPKEPEKRSRLWDPKEIYDVLKYNKGTESIESIALDMSQIKEVTLSPQTFQRMYKLRLVNIYMPSHENRSPVHIPKGLLRMASELSYLRWDFFPWNSLPPSFCAEKLVELYLKHSLVEKLWDGVQDLVNLKSLYLCGCKHLTELPDLSLASKLEEVHLDDCTSLMSVPSYMLSLESLLLLNLRGCKQLDYIQSEKKSRSLRRLNLGGCSNLLKYSVFSEKLEYLMLDGTMIEYLPSFVIGLDCTSQLLDCPKLEKLPPTCETSMPIIDLCLDNCSNLTRLPDDLGLLSKLNKLSLVGSNIEILPTSIKYLSQLRALNVSNCRRLRSLPELPFLLQDLNASNCISLETVSNLGITMLKDSFGRLKKRSLLRQIQGEENMSIRHGDYFGKFDFYNCINLDKTACKTVIEEALVRIQLAAYLSSEFEECCVPFHQIDRVAENFDVKDFVYIPRPVYSILPGNEVPDWFVHKKVESWMITIEFSSRVLNNLKCLGFAFCIVLGPSGSDSKKSCRTNFVAGCRCYFRRKDAGTCIIMSSYDDAESNQVCLWYDQISIFSDSGCNAPFEEFSFEFFVQPHNSGLVVKQCAARPLCAPCEIMPRLNEKSDREGKRPYMDLLHYAGDPDHVVSELRETCYSEILTAGPAKEPEKKDGDNNKDPRGEIDEMIRLYREYNPHFSTYYYVKSVEEDPNACAIC